MSKTFRNSPDRRQSALVTATEPSDDLLFLAFMIFFGAMCFLLAAMGKLA